MLKQIFEVKINIKYITCIIHHIPKYIGSMFCLNNEKYGIFYTTIFYLKYVFKIGIRICNII